MTRRTVRRRGAQKGGEGEENPFRSRSSAAKLPPFPVSAEVENEENFVSDGEEILQEPTVMTTPEANSTSRRIFIGEDGETPKRLLEFSTVEPPISILHQLSEATSSTDSSVLPSAPSTHQSMALPPLPPSSNIAPEDSSIQVDISDSQPVAATFISPGGTERPKTSRGKSRPTPDDFYNYVIPSPDAGRIQAKCMIFHANESSGNSPHRHRTAAIKASQKSLPFPMDPSYGIHQQTTTENELDNQSLPELELPISDEEAFMNSSDVLVIPSDDEQEEEQQPDVRQSETFESTWSSTIPPQVEVEEQRFGNHVNGIPGHALAAWLFGSALRL